MILQKYSAWISIRLIPLIRRFTKCPGYYLPYLIHFIQNSSCLFFTAAPFVVTTKGSLATLSRSKGIRKYAVVLLQSAVALRVGFLAFLIYDPHFKVSYKGLFTIDLCIFAVTVLVSGVSSFFGLTLLYYQEDVVKLYNGFNAVNKHFSKRYLGLRNILHLHKNNKVLSAISLLLLVAILLTPVLIAVNALVLHNSPVLLPYHLTGPVYDLSSPKSFVLVAHFIALAADCVLMYIGVYGFSCASNILIESMLSITFLITALGSPALDHVKWEEKLFIYKQLELVMNCFNCLFSHLVPILLLIMLSLTVVSNVLLVRLNGLNVSISLPFAYAVLGGISVSAPIMGVIILHHAEILPTKSNEFLESVVYGVINEMNRRQIRNCPTIVTSRRYHRRSLAAKIGNFRYIKDGLGMEFIQVVIDNMVTWIFMVTVECPPWLI